MDKEPVLRRSISIGEALVSALTLLGVIIGFYTSVLVRLNALELKQAQYEVMQAEAKAARKEAFDKVNTKLDQIQTNLYDIKLQMQNKQDKK